MISSAEQNLPVPELDAFAQYVAVADVRALDRFGAVAGHFHLEEAGEASDGTPLFAVYRRERTQTSSSNPNPKKEQ